MSPFCEMNVLGGHLDRVSRRWEESLDACYRMMLDRSVRLSNVCSVNPSKLLHSQSLASILNCIDEAAMTKAFWMLLSSGDHAD